MTTTPTDSQEKTHADNMGSFIGYIADIENATPEQRAQDATISQLDSLQDDLNLPTNHIDNTRYLHADISMRGANSKGDRLPNTKGRYGLVMVNNKAEPINIAARTPNNDNEPPIISDTTQPSAYAIGPMSRDSDWWLVTSLSDQVTLYAALAMIDSKVTVFACLNQNMFDMTLKHLSKVKTIHIIDTAQHKDALTSRLEGVNAIAHITIDTIISRLNEGDLIGDLITDADTIDLQALGKPKPKPISQTLPPVKTLTSAMMPKLLWDYASNCAERLSVPIEYVLMPVMVSLGSLIGSKLSIYPKMYDNWEVVPNFYGAIVGNPSSKKSPSLSEGLKPLSHLVSLAKDKYNEDKLEHDTQKELNKHMTKAAEKQLSDLAKKLATQADDDTEISQEDLKAKAQELAEAKQSDELIPEIKRYVTDDGTIESIGELESKHKNGMLVKRDELTGWLASLESESNQQARSFYLEGFNGLGSFQVDRIGRGSVFVDTHCLSVIGGIQPDKLEYYLSKTMKGLGNDGLIQRFQLMVYPDPLPNSKERDLPPDKQSRDAIYDLFETIDSMQLGDFMRYGANPIDEYHKRPYYRFNDEAYQEFMSWYDALKLRAGDAEHSVIAEHLIKYAKTVPSLALVFHLVDCIEHGTSLGAVNMNALRAALAWCEVLESHMMRIYSTVTDSANIKASYLADKIMKMVRKGTDKTDKTDWISHGFTARQLIRKGWKGLTDADDVLNALEILVENDWLSWQEIPSTGQGGRPTERYSINSRLSELL